jgi:hypothetical protein
MAVDKMTIILYRKFSNVGDFLGIWQLIGNKKSVLNPFEHASKKTFNP